VKCPKCHSNKAIKSKRGNVALMRILRPLITSVRCGKCGHRYYRLTGLDRDLTPPTVFRCPGYNGPINHRPRPATAERRDLTDSQDPLDLSPSLQQELLSRLLRQTAQQRQDLLNVFAMVPTSDEGLAGTSLCRTRTPAM
jgi:hypothetical protein